MQAPKGEEGRNCGIKEAALVFCFEVCPRMTESSSRTILPASWTKAILVTAFRTCTYKARPIPEVTENDGERKEKKANLAVDSLVLGVLRK